MCDGEDDVEEEPPPAPSPALALGKDEGLTPREGVSEGDCDSEEHSVALAVLQDEGE